MAEVRFGGELAEEIPDEKLIAIGKAAVFWHAENVLEHDVTCPLRKPWRTAKASDEQPPVECNCGTAAFEAALLAIWEE